MGRRHIVGLLTMEKTTMNTIKNAKGNEYNIDPEIAAYIVAMRTLSFGDSKPRSKNASY